MRGLLLLAVEHGQRLRENRGEYSMPETPDERFKLYNREADPIVRFSRTAVEPAGPSQMIRKDDVYRVYQSMMDAWQERAAGERGFKRQFPSTVTEDVETARSRALANEDDDDERVRCWKRIQWTSEATKFMPDWMKERYSDHFEEDNDQSAGSNEDDTETPLGAREVGHGQSFTAEVAAVSAGEYSREAQGQLKCPHGTYITFVVPGDNENQLAGRQGETLHFEGVTLRTDDDGLLEAVINDAVTIAATGSGQSGLDSHGPDTDTAAADGGQVDDEQLEGPKATVHEHLQLEYDHNGKFTTADVAGELADRGLSPDDVEKALDALVQQEVIQREGDSTFRVLW
jgi:hypothetical protein